MKNNIKNLFKIKDINKKNLPKKPAKGGIPANEKKNTDKIIPKYLLVLPKIDKSHNNLNFSLFNFLIAIKKKNIPNKINKYGKKK